MIERIPIKTNPKLFDLVVSKVQTTLGSLPWLDHIFGICEKLTDVKNNVKYHTANTYVGRGRYEQIMPCAELGNFSFFVLRDPQTISSNGNGAIYAPFSLIIWYNMNKVSLPLDERNREQIKWLILKTLKDAHYPWFKITKIYERPENIFEGFSYDYTTNQFLMAPYAGLRIDGEMSVTLPCL